MKIPMKMSVAKTTEVKTWRIRGLGAKSCDPLCPPAVSQPLQGWPPPHQCTALSAGGVGLSGAPGQQAKEEWESIGGSDGTPTTGSLPHILSVNSSHRLPFTRSHIH